MKDVLVGRDKIEAIHNKIFN